jgi:hypothetical protein
VPTGTVQLTGTVLPTATVVPAGTVLPTGILVPTATAGPGHVTMSGPSSHNPALQPLTPDLLVGKYLTYQ